MKTLLLTLLCASACAGTCIEYKSSADGEAPWSLTNYASANPWGELRANDVWTFGYNAGPNNAKMQADKPSCALVVEAFYALDASARVMETYWSIKEPNNTEHRPFGFIYWHGTGQINGHSATASFSWFNNTLTSQYMIFNVADAPNSPAEILLANGTVINSYANNTSMIGQQNAAGTARRSLIYLDNHDKVTLGGNGDDVRIVADVELDPNSKIELSATTSIYAKGSKLVVKYNDSGTIRYRSLELSGSAISWEHSLTEP